MREPRAHSCQALITDVHLSPHHYGRRVITSSGRRREDTEQRHEAPQPAPAAAPPRATLLYLPPCAVPAAFCLLSVPCRQTLRRANPATLHMYC
ncbi:hypothetical protein E2C01_073811 [Portunus trituberculatus]|uniref:Uncharacterized protein n=1 Tax=Portunus trituberculatus TaxID=210409 RepID=A0A5B7I6C4_PORTR|nr:hypothetical protein [Portunus trituberculatus]